MLQLLCFTAREWITGTLSLCLAWRMVLYCWFCAVEWCRWFSWWKALGFHAVKPERINHADSHNLPGVWTLYKRTLDATNVSWLLALYAWSMLGIMANRMCMASQQSSTLLILCWWKLVSLLLLMLKEPNGYVWNTANGWILSWGKQSTLFVFLWWLHT